MEEHAYRLVGQREAEEHPPLGSCQRRQAEDGARPAVQPAPPQVAGRAGGDQEREGGGLQAAERPERQSAIACKEAGRHQVGRIPGA